CATRFVLPTAEMSNAPLAEPLEQPPREALTDRPAPRPAERAAPRRWPSRAEKPLPVKGPTVAPWMVLLVVGSFVAAAGALSVGGVVAYLFVGRSSTGPAASTVPAPGPAPAQAQTWATFASRAGLFQVKMPGTPPPAAPNQSLNGVRLIRYVLGPQPDGAVYTVGYLDFPGNSLTPAKLTAIETAE